MPSINLQGYDLPAPYLNAMQEIIQAYLNSGEILAPGSASTLPTSTAFSTTWDTAASKDMGTYTATGALAFVSSDVSSVVGGSTFAVIAPAGFSATFDGASNAGWLTGANNVVGLYRIGTTVIWTVNGTQSTRAISTPTVPVNTLPTIVTATAGSALVWTGGSAAGSPTPTAAFAWLTSADVLVQDNITSGSYTPPASGSFKLRMTSTNSQGTDVDTLAVTVSAAVTAPGAPTTLTLGATAQTTQALTWTAPASNGGSAITGYRVGYRTPAGSGVYTYVATGSTTTSYSLTGLTASTAYDFVVQATNAIGDSVDSGLVSATTAIEFGQRIIMGLVPNATSFTNDGPNPYTMGGKIQNNAAGTVPALWAAVKDSSMFGATATAVLYDSTDTATALATKAVTLPNVTGWYRIVFDTPVSVAANRTLVYGVHHGFATRAAVPTTDQSTANLTYVAANNGWAKAALPIGCPDTLVAVRMYGVDMEFVPS